MSATTTLLDDDHAPSSPARSALRGLLGATLVFAGTSHLTNQREAFRAQVPAWVPLDEDLVVLLSGAVEIALGLALLATLLPRFAHHRVAVGLVVAAFFVAIFPGNVGQLVEHQDAFGLDTDAKRAVRLLFQPLLVAWALWSTGALPPLLRAVRERRASAPTGGAPDR